MSLVCYTLVLRSQTVFSVFVCGGGKKGLVTLPKIFYAVEYPVLIDDDPKRRC